MRTCTTAPYCTDAHASTHVISAHVSITHEQTHAHMHACTHPNTYTYKTHAYPHIHTHDIDQCWRWVYLLTHCGACHTAATLLENRKLRARLRAKSLQLKRFESKEDTVKALQLQLADSSALIR